MTTSIDPTTTSAWSALSAHHKSLTPNLREWFAADPERAQKLSFTADETARRPVQEPDYLRNP